MTLPLINAGAFARKAIVLTYSSNAQDVNLFA